MVAVKRLCVREVLYTQAEYKDDVDWNNYRTMADIDGFIREISVATCKKDGVEDNVEVFGISRVIEDTYI